jgi:hypothetical protein
MALTAEIIGVSANCNAISSGITLFEENYTISIFLIEGDVETEIYRGVDNASEVNTVNIDNLTDSNFNEIYDVTAELDAIIEGVLSFNGIFKIEVTDEVDTVEYYSIGTCSIDCCLANLIQTNLDCTCTDGDCCEDIKKAEKIFILTRGAILDAANGDIAGATEKYNKAVEICDAQPCDCNC